MRPSDPRQPPSRDGTGDDHDTPRKLVTVGGVEVNVKAWPPVEPRREPDPEDRSPRAIIFPEGQSEEEIRAFLDGLCKAHVKVVENLLESRKDVLAESRKDLRQRVLLVLVKHVVETHEVPTHMGAFLGEVVRKVVKNHKRRAKLPVDDGADAESVPESADQKPEDEAELAEKVEDVERYLLELPDAVAEVIRCMDQFGLTLDETAEVVGRPPTTVFRQLKKGRALLHARASKSERAPAPVASPPSAAARGKARG